MSAAEGVERCVQRYLGKRPRNHGQNWTGHAIPNSPIMRNPNAEKRWYGVSTAETSCGDWVYGSAAASGESDRGAGPAFSLAQFAYSSPWVAEHPHILEAQQCVLHGEGTSLAG